MSPVADHPTATTSGSILPRAFGPLLDHGAIWPHVPLERLLNAPTENTPLEAPGDLVVPNPCPPLPIATAYDVFSL